jgi:hypothetical protein
VKYATRDVFICAEQIIFRHRRSLLDYCVYHRERGDLSKYEGYIHLVACHCLVHSNFLAPTVQFEMVEFAEEERKYSHSLLTSINSSKANAIDFEG